MQFTNWFYRAIQQCGTEKNNAWQDTDFNFFSLLSWFHSYRFTLPFWLDMRTHWTRVKTKSKQTNWFIQFYVHISTWIQYSQPSDARAINLHKILLWFECTERQLRRDIAFLYYYLAILHCAIVCRTSVRLVGFFISIFFICFILLWYQLNIECAANRFSMDFLFIFFIIKVPVDRRIHILFPSFVFDRVEWKLLQLNGNWNRSGTNGCCC